MWVYFFSIKNPWVFKCMVFINKIYFTFIIKYKHIPINRSAYITRTTLILNSKVNMYNIIWLYMLNRLVTIFIASSWVKEEFPKVVKNRQQLWNQIFLVAQFTWKLAQTNKHLNTVWYIEAIHEKLWTNFWQNHYP